VMATGDAEVLGLKLVPVLLVTTNFTWTGLELTSSLHDERLGTHLVVVARPCFV
jgi:hypothetical protein